MSLSDKDLIELFDKRMEEHNKSQETEDGYIEPKAISVEDFAMLQEIFRRDIADEYYNRR